MIKMTITKRFFIDILSLIIIEIENEDRLNKKNFKPFQLQIKRIRDPQITIEFLAETKLTVKIQDEKTDIDLEPYLEYALEHKEQINNIHNWKSKLISFLITKRICALLETGNIHTISECKKLEKKPNIFFSELPQGYSPIIRKPKQKNEIAELLDEK